MLTDVYRAHHQACRAQSAARLGFILEKAIILQTLGMRAYLLRQQDWGVSRDWPTRRCRRCELWILAVSSSTYLLMTGKSISVSLTFTVKSGGDTVVRSSRLSTSVVNAADVLVVAVQGL